jgi:ribosomal protein L11 methylase PrmA
MKFTQAWHELKKWNDARRAELIPVVCERTDNKVMHGIFSGMKILPKWSWGDGDHAAKVLGIYESELYDAAENHFSSNIDIVINIGCAEGFWGIGAALRTSSPLILVDIDENALTIAKENCAENNIEAETFSFFDTDILQAGLSQSVNPLVIMDCEGAEEQYLDLEKVPALSHTRIIVETHDCNKAGLSDLIADRFSNTHHVEWITQGAKNPYIEPIHDFGDEDKWLLVNENRPSTMVWLNLTPKK